MSGPHDLSVYTQASTATRNASLLSWLPAGVAAGVAATAALAAPSSDDDRAPGRVALVEGLRADSPMGTALQRGHVGKSPGEPIWPRSHGSMQPTCAQHTQSTRANQKKVVITTSQRR